MKIVTFYSYKGGTGRSLSLVNTACSLNLSLGQTVGLVDLDVEAPALHDLLGVDPGGANLLSLLLPQVRSVPNLESHVITVPLTDRNARGLHLLPCISDSKVLDELDWGKGIEIFLREEIFPAFGSIYSLDFLLIDSRSGLSEFARFSLMVSDLIVLVCRPDRQNKFGIRKVITACQAAGKPFLILVASCPEPERNRGKIEAFSQAIGSQVDFVLPFLESLYFDEEISVLSSTKRELGERYEELARFIHSELR